MNQIAGPSYRQIVDLSDLENSRYLNPLGQNGNQFSPGYTALLDMWADGKYVRMGMENYDGHHMKFKP